MNRSRSNYFGFKFFKCKKNIIATLISGALATTFSPYSIAALEASDILAGSTVDMGNEDNDIEVHDESDKTYDFNMIVGASNEYVDAVYLFNSTNITFSGVISESGYNPKIYFTNGGFESFLPYNSATLNLSGKNTISGTLVARGLTLGVFEESNLGTKSAKVELSNGGLLGYKTFSMGQKIISDSGKNNITASNDTTLTLTGVISGTGELSLGDATKPTGTVRLEGDNTGLTKGITVAGGALEFKEDKNLGAAGNALTMNDNTTLRTTQDTSLSRQIVMGDNWNMDTASGSTFTYDGKLTGAKNINKLGDGTFILNSSADVVEGKVKVAGGNMQVGSADHTDIKLTSTGSVDIDAGATLSGYGIVESDINNSGNIQVGSVAPLPATPAATSLFDTITNTLLTVVGNLNNSGEIHLENAAGTAGNELKIDGNYTGTNGKLVLGSVLGMTPLQPIS